MKKFILLIIAIIYCYNYEVKAQFEYYGPPSGFSCISAHDGVLFGGFIQDICTSTNDGILWSAPQMLRDGATILSICVTDDLILVGTKSEIYTSSDKGFNWNIKNYYQVSSFFKDGSNIYTTSGIASSLQDKYLLFSNNLGKNWSTIKTNLKNDVALNKLCKVGTKLFSASSTGILTSSDSAYTWLQGAASLANINMIDICTNNDIIFASSDSSGIYISSDKGATWKQSNKGLAEIASLKLCVCDNKIYAASPNKGLFVSLDNGATWTQVKTGIPNPHLTCIFSEGDNIYVSSTSCVFKSADKGATWLQINDGIATYTYTPFIVEKSDVYAASGSSLFIGSNNGKHWEEILYCDSLNLKYNYIYTLNKPLCKNGSDIYVVQDLNIIYSSSDAGATWNHYKASGISDKYFLTDLAISNNNLIAGTKGGNLYSSKDRGATWTIANTGCNDLNIVKLSAYKNKIFALGEKNVYSSKDDGATWNKLPNWPKNGLTFLFTPNKIFFGAKDGAYVSEDDGATFRQICNERNIKSICTKGDTTFLSGDSLYISYTNAYKWGNITGYYFDGNCVAVNSDYVFISSQYGIGVSKLNLDLKPPKLIFPANSSTNQLCWIELSWQYLQRSDSYHFQAALDSNFTNIISDIMSTTHNVVSLYNLANSTKYYWRVQTIRNNQKSDWSEIRNFTTIGLSAPELYAPNNKSVNIAPGADFLCNMNGDHGEYRMQLALDSTFTQVIFDSTMSTFFYKSHNLSNNTKYYWRVNFSKNKIASPWSEIWSFTTSKFDSPYLIYPLNKSTNINTIFVLKFGSSCTVDSTRIQISSDSSFKNIILDSNLKITAALISGLSYKTKYFIRGKSYYAGSESDWSDIWYFSTYEFAAPKLHFPQNGATDVSSRITLDWNYNLDVTGYNFQISLDSTFTSPIYNSFSSSRFAEIGDLKNNTKYYWRANAIKNKELSPWSETWSFTTEQLVPPSLSFPNNSSKLLKSDFNLKWIKHCYATTYQYQIAADSNFTGIIKNFYTSKTEEKIGFSVNNGTNYWRVRSGNLSNWSEWSETWSFTLIDLLPPNLVYPPNNSMNIPVNTLLACNYGMEIDSYRYTVATDSNFKNIVIEQTYPLQQFNLDILENNTKYYWRALATYLSDISPWSETWSFTTSTFIAPTLSAPANNSVNVSVNPILSWNYDYAINNFHYQVALDSNFKNTIAEQSTPDRQINLTNLANHTKYYWRIYAKNSVENSPWSETWSFTTAGTGDVYANSPGGEEISISPNPASDFLIINYKFEDVDAVNLRIYNTLGEQILFMPNLNSVGSSRIDISGFYPGNYRLVFSAGGRKVVKTACVCR